MEEKNGFNRGEPQSEGSTKGVLFKIGLMAVSLILAIFTVVVVNI